MRALKLVRQIFRSVNKSLSAAMNSIDDVRRTPPCFIQCAPQILTKGPQHNHLKPRGDRDENHRRCKPLHWHVMENLVIGFIKGEENSEGREDKTYDRNKADREVGKAYK